MASCLEGIGDPFLVAGWKCQFSSAARHLRVDVRAEALQDGLTDDLPALIDGDLDHFVAGCSGSCHGQTTGSDVATGSAGRISSP